MTAKVSDHLANERTFLAWVRTSLGLIGLGFVLARMGLFVRQIALTAQGLAGKGGVAIHGLHGGHEFLVSGVIFLAIGTAFCAWSGWAYQRNRQAIDADRFVPDKLSIVVLTSVVALGGLALAALVLWRMLAEG